MHRNASLATIDCTSPNLLFTHTGTRWDGRGSLKNLFVFGDSYSSRLSEGREIDEDDIQYGANDDDITWVDFLASANSSDTSAVILNNFAFPGATVEYDLTDQLARFFDRLPVSEEIAPEQATYAFFLGINDCGGYPGEGLSFLVEHLFNAIHRLYIDAFARNFILVDVPPTNRSPAAAGTTIDIASRIEEWNNLLVAHSADFVSNTTQVTMQVFSFHKVLSEVLDNPSALGFPEMQMSW